MAQVVTCTFTFTDAKRKNSRVQFHTDIAPGNIYGFGNFNDPLTDAVDYFQEVGRRIDLICKGRLTSIDMQVHIALPTVKVTPTADSDVEEIALFEWFGSATGYWKNSLPSFDHALFGGTTQISAQAVAEIAYFTFLIGNPGAALDWSPGYGGITDTRGDPVGNDDPLVFKRFRR